MKKVFKLFQKKCKIPVALLVLLSLVTIFRITVTSPNAEKIHEVPISIPSIEYMEDKSGILSLKEIQSKGLDEKFLRHTGSILSIGQSRATWWIRIELDNLPAGDGSKYISIANPSVEKAVLYLPVRTESGIKYEAFRSGWSFRGNTQDEGFVYPVFRLDDNVVKDKFVYLQLSSPYTQSYNIRMLRDTELNTVKLKNMLVVGTFYGFLLAMGIINIINFLSLRNSVHIYYVLYVFGMLVYQGALLGAYRIFMGKFAEALIENVVVWGLFMVITAIMFFRSFLDTPKSFPTLDKISLLLIFICFLDIVLLLSGWRYEGSCIATVLGDIASILIYCTTVLAVRKGIEQAKYFLIGWTVMLLGVIIFSARIWGMIPNNDLTLVIILLSASVEAILLSMAVTARVKTLRNEKDDAILLFQKAEEVSISNESAFLQAQIKPHFLYNTLNIIAALCRIDAAKARELILDLSSYLHHSFYFRNLSKYVTFDEELEFIKAYVRIEQARFKDKLKIEYEIEDTGELWLPPLILQPLVENAIRHGIRKSDDGGTVTVRVKNLADSFLIEVEDDGAGMTGEQIKKIMSENVAASGGVGLVNIQKRLLRLYGTQLVIRSQPGEGTTIALILPKGKEND